MPEHRGIHVALVSQYDAMFIPECRSPNNNVGGEEERENGTHVVDTFISNYAASQFWIRYACDMATQDLETRFLYFKLYVNGVFSVAWGCGAQDEWEGETSFAPSDVSRKKLGLFFPRNIIVTSEEPAFGILVYRAKAAAMTRDKDGVVQYAGYGYLNTSCNIADAV
jgi:hypothetical protein